jgi:Neuraminidase (sialidase)
MSGANQENSDAVASSIKYITNSASNIIVSVSDDNSGTWSCREGGGNLKVA